MTYSANSTAAPGYGVGYAVADKPLGPWVKSQDNPLLTSNLDAGVSSPGHNSITISPDGKEMFIVSHTHTDPKNTKGARVVNIDRMVFDKSGALRVLGPTRSPQRLPSGAHLAASRDRLVSLPALLQSAPRNPGQAAPLWGSRLYR